MRIWQHGEDGYFHWGKYIHIFIYISRWWFQMIFLFSPPSLGKMNPFWLIFFFEMGWFNHQTGFVEGDFLRIGSYRIHHHERTTILETIFFCQPSKQHIQEVCFCVSHEKTPTTFFYTGWLIGILTMVYYNPYIITGYNPLYNPTNQGIFHGSCGLSPLFLWNADVLFPNGACWMHWHHWWEWKWGQPFCT